MFGLEILDIILGLAFVYLLLSLICSAINEYLASLLNKRGRVLMDGLETMLKDIGVYSRFFDHPLISTNFPHHQALVERARKIEKWLPGTRWIYRFFTWAFKPSVRRERYPSYLTARSFATAFLEISQSLGALPSGTGAAAPPAAPQGDTRPPATSTSSTAVTDMADDESEDAKPSAGSSADATAAGPAPGDGTLSGSSPVNVEARITSAAPADPAAIARLKELLGTLERDAALDVAPFPNLALLGSLGSQALPEDVKQRLAAVVLRERDKLQKLQTSVEVWFNSSMDRVSGAYKRHTQHVLFFIGLAVALALNTDTIDLWRRLSTDDKLRDTLATQAAAAMPQLASLASDSARGDTITRDTVRADTTHTTLPIDTTGGNPRPTGDTTKKANADTTKDRLARARAVFDSSTALLDRTTLNLGWSLDDLAALGLATRLDSARADSVRTAAIETDSARTVERLAARGGQVDSAAAGRKAADDNPRRTYRVHGPGSWRLGPILAKLLGLLLTAFALSLGAPFWFDTLNKIVNIRAAGRAPATTPAPTPAEGAKSDGK